MSAAFQQVADEVRASAASGTAPLGLRPEPVPVSAIRRVSHDADYRSAIICAALFGSLK